MVDFLQRGVLMDEAGDGGGGGGVAVADAASDFGGGEQVSDGGPEDTGGDDGIVHEADFVEPSTELARTDQQPVKAGERAVQNGKFTASGRAAIEAVKALSPQLSQEIIQSLLVRDWFKKEFPGGKKEIAELRELVQTNNGKDGLKELRNTATFFDNLDQLFSKSDPRFFDEITTTDQEKQAFVGLMGAAFEKFQKLGPQQFAYHNAKNFVHLMDQARMPVISARMVDLLNRAGKYLSGGNSEMAASFIAEIIETHNQLADILGKVYDTASKQPEALGATTNPQLDDRTKQISEREKGLLKQELAFSVTTERKRVFSKAWAELTKGRNLNSDQEENIKGFYELQLTAKVKNWQNQGERFIANSDKDGYLREQYAFFQKAIPDALRQAIQRALPGNPGPKQTAGGPLKPPVVPRGTSNGQNGSANVVRVAKMPQTSNLDVVRTTSAMLSENKAYGKDGKVYQWA